MAIPVAGLLGFAARFGLRAAFYRAGRSGTAFYARRGGTSVLFEADAASPGYGFHARSGGVMGMAFVASDAANVAHWAYGEYRKAKNRRQRAKRRHR